MRIPVTKEFLWYAFFVCICLATFFGRFLLLQLYPDFFDVSWEIGRYDFAEKSFSFFPYAHAFLSNSLIFVGVFVLACFSSVSILFQKVRIFALSVVLFLFLLFSEAQYVVSHVGDTLFVGMLVCIIFGQKYRWLFVQILISLMWVLSGIDKIINGNWFSGEAFQNVIRDDSITYEWMQSVFVHEGVMQIISFSVPIVQFVIGASMIAYLFSKNSYIRLLGCVLLPALTCLIFLGNTVGLLPFKVFLCSLAFYLPATRLVLPSRKYFSLVVPVLYLIALFILNVPSLRINSRENFYFAPFTYVDTPFQPEVQYQKQLIDESPWLLDRYTRFYATYKQFLENNTLSE